jgi:hypothetical protein
LSFAGESGSVSVKVGVAGAIESSTYVTDVDEQADRLPAASVALARRVVVVLSATVAVSPAPANVAALPPATGVPLQSAVGKMATVVPAGAVPLTSGALSLAGESGSVSVTLGAAGGVSSPFGA